MWPKSNFTININALCKNHVVIPNQQIILDLKAVKVETTFKYYKSGLKNSIFLAKIATRNIN